MNQTVKMLPNLALALLVVVLFYLLARIVKRLTLKLFSRISSNISLNHLIANVFFIIVISIGAFVALDILKLEKTVTSLLAGLGLVGLALGFAFQDTAANFISGIFLAMRTPINTGDIVEIGTVKGVVQKINLRATEIETFQGTLVVIPNKDVFQNPIFNYSHNGRRRVDLECGISYGEDLEKVRKVSLAAVEKVEGVSKERPVVFHYSGYGDSSIDFTVKAWVIGAQRQGEFLDVQSEMVIALKKAFNENDITIPFPIRTLDFGIKGGEKLNAMLKNTSQSE
jgi:small-conductance mechanosensitive channel